MTSTCDHYAFDAQVRTEHGIFCGVDEAGRGPLCGPVCCAAVILHPDDPIEGIDDSKKLSEKKREALYDVICDRALAWNVVLVGPDVIDRDNILNATMSGMRQAVEGLGIVPNFVLVDGNRCPAGLTMRCGSLYCGRKRHAENPCHPDRVCAVYRDGHEKRRAAPEPGEAAQRTRPVGPALHDGHGV